MSRIVWRILLRNIEESCRKRNIQSIPLWFLFKIFFAIQKRFFRGYLYELKQSFWNTLQGLFPERFLRGILPGSLKNQLEFWRSRDNSKILQRWFLFYNFYFLFFTYWRRGGGIHLGFLRIRSVSPSPSYLFVFLRATRGTSQSIVTRIPQCFNSNEPGEWGWGGREDGRRKRTLPFNIGRRWSIGRAGQRCGIVSGYCQIGRVLRNTRRTVTSNTWNWKYKSKSAFRFNFFFFSHFISIRLLFILHSATL